MVIFEIEGDSFGGAQLAANQDGSQKGNKEVTVRESRAKVLSRKERNRRQDLVLDPR